MPPPGPFLLRYFAFFGALRFGDFFGVAAGLVATCVACDPTAETTRWAALQVKYRRFPALRDELERALRAP